MRRAIWAFVGLLLAAAARGQVEEINDVIYEPNDPPTVATTHTILSTTHSDTTVTTPNDGDVLTWSVSSSTWGPAAAAGGGAPTTAHYVTTQAEAGLSAESSIGALTTALLLNTVSGGVGTLSAYGGGTCTNQVATAVSAAGGLTCSSITNAMITNSTIDLTTKVTGRLPLANVAAAAANSRIVGSGSAGSGASYAELTTSTHTFGASSFDVALTQSNDGGAVVAQSSSPGTQQGSGGNKNINVNGKCIVELDAINTTITPAITLQNTTAATSGQNQRSGAFQQCGTGWNTTGLASETDCMAVDVSTSNGNPTTAQINYLASINGGALTNVGNLNSAGSLTLSGAANVNGGNLSVSQTNALVSLSGGSTTGAGGFQYTMSNGGLGRWTGIRSVTAACSSGTTCDGGTNLPANAVVLGVGYRITTSITGATTIELGTATVPAAFCTGITTLTSGSTGVCSGASTLTGSSAVAPRATATAGTYTAGVIEFEIYYLVITAPTS